MSLTLQLKKHGASLDPTFESLIAKYTKRVARIVDPSFDESFLEIEINEESRHTESSHRYTVEATLDLAKTLFRSESSDRSFESALGASIDGLVRQVTHHLDKKQTLLKKGGLTAKESLQ